MLHAVIRSLATANPPCYLTQKEAYEVLDRRLSLEGKTGDLYRKLFLESPIQGRYLAVDHIDETFETSQGKLTERFLKQGRRLALEASRKALAAAGVEAGEVDAIVVNTCTGYLCPGLSSYLAEDLSLSSSLKFVDLMGMGCGGAIPNLECGVGLLARQAASRVLCVSVEVCSATVYLGPEPDLIVSNAIFGDGASAALLVAAGQESPFPRLVDFESGIFPEYREKLRYRTQCDGRLRNVLSREVPVIGTEVITTILARLLSRHHLGTEDIAWWAVHAGGLAILDRIEKKLSLPTSAMQWSRRIFTSFGNMSSPTLMFALQNLLQQGSPRSGEKGVLLGFGAGFSGFGALVVF
ncbi:MAG: 3-oxoacyl-ACP synthase [Desulfuromonadaceae bacterium]|nr:3-oxoacyl-ACP synthase [Desulfuromonadaceae bacterium]